MEPEPDQSFFIFPFLFVPLAVMPIYGVVALVLLVIILLICSALISSSEVAFFSLTPNDLEKLEQENTPASQNIIKLKDTPRTLLATILISNNFINIGIVVISDFILRGLLPVEVCENWVSTFLSFLPDTLLGISLGICLHFIITVIGVTFLLVLFGEVAPKVYAKLNNVKLAKMMSGTLLSLNSIFQPLSQVLVKGTSLIENRLVKNTSNVTSKEDIDSAIELAVKDDKNAEQEIDILKGVVKFGETTAKQIMRSRVDVIAVDFRIQFDELMKVIRESGFSRIPVFDEDFDNITGILYVKDLLGHLEESKDFEWQVFIRPNVLYIPEAKKINDLLKEFQKQRLHMAIVVDEYGGSSGLATLEDIMEEVIGEIRDEFDDEKEVDFQKIDDFNYIFEGKTLLNDVCRVIGVDTNTFDEIKGEADSFAGMILEIVGQIPKKNRKVPYNQYQFKIVSVSKRRIEKIQITLPKE